MHTSSSRIFFSRGRENGAIVLLRTVSGPGFGFPQHGMKASGCSLLYTWFFSFQGKLFFGSQDGAPYRIVIPVLPRYLSTVSVP
ncbi:MAG: hypothetical protein ACOC2H_03665 [Spirochaetota bacterium]